MKNKGLIISLIVVLSIVVIALIVFMVSIIDNKINFRGFTFINKVSKELILDKTYENKYDSIEIDSSVSDIYVKESTDDRIRVVIYGDEEKLNIVDNTSLKIKLEEKNSIGFNWNLKKNKIEVYLPSSYDKKFLISNDYGDIRVGRFNSEFIINEDCGDVEVSYLKKATINNKYGDITIGSVDDVKVVADCGDIEIKTTNNAIVENKYGDISIDRVNNYLDIIDDCGDIEIDNLSITKDSKIKNDYGDIEIGNTNDIYIDAKTDLGDVDINNNYHKSDITLQIKNDCGDIEVDN